MVNNTQQRVFSDDYSLLKLMLDDAKSAPSIYKPGTYWSKQTKISSKEIKKHGLDNFRGDSNSIATSYSDSLYVDVRHQLNFGMRIPLGFLFSKVFPFSRIFNSQVNLCRGYVEANIALKNEIANTSPQVKNILNKYALPIDTLRGGCLDFCEIDGKKVSNHYLNLLNTHHTLAQHIDFSSAQSFFEIGGGFGVNLHLLIENYKNIKKYIYLDIPPNLYVGTKYLESFYGNSVKSYRDTRSLKNISFSKTNELEIICITPNQIEYLDTQIDIFQNSHSFVEMPKEIVCNYATHIQRILNPNKAAIALVSYDGFDLNTTFCPDELPQFFSGSFTKYEETKLFSSVRKNYHYISNSI